MLDKYLEIVIKYEVLISSFLTFILIIITIGYNQKIIKETKKNNEISKETLKNLKEEIENGKRVKDLEIVSDFYEKGIISEGFFFLLDKKSFKKYIDSMKEKFKKEYVENKLENKRFENIGDFIIAKTKDRIYYSSDNKTFNKAFNSIYKLIEDLKFLKGILIFKPHEELIKRILDNDKIENYNFYKRKHKNTIFTQFGVGKKLKSSDIDEEEKKILEEMWGYNNGFDKQLKENCYYFENTKENLNNLKNIYNNFEYFKIVLEAYKKN